MTIKTVGDIRKAIEGYSDDTEVGAYDLHYCQFVEWKIKKPSEWSCPPNPSPPLLVSMGD